MATLSAQNPTLLDLAALPENSEAKEIVEMLAQHNPILEDAPAFECNRGTYHQTTIRTGLPEVFWGRYYKGTPASKSTKQMVKDTPGFLEAASEVDARLIDIEEKAEDKASLMLDEASGFLEAMAQEWTRSIFYHDSDVDAEKPTGFAPRFNSLSAQNGGQIIDGGGSGNDNTSVWMITWDKTTNHLIYPKGGSLGIQHENMVGKQLVEDADGNRYKVYREDYTLHTGLSVRDWRYTARLANIDVSDLTSDASTGANLIDLLTKMWWTHEGRRSAKGKTCMYLNKDIMEYLDYQARNVPNNLLLKYSETGVNAKPVLMFRNIPLRECDGLLSTESTIS